MNVIVSVFHVTPYSAKLIYIYCTLFAETQITIILNTQVTGAYCTVMANWPTNLPSNFIEETP